MSGRAPGAVGAGAPVSIVCAYQDGALPSSWFQAVQRARRTIRRAGYRARVDVVPASGVPVDADVVIASAAVAGGLRDRFGELVVAEPATLNAAFDALVERLVATGRLQRGPEPPRTVAVHRGFQAIGERARLAE